MLTNFLYFQDHVGRDHWDRLFSKLLMKLYTSCIEICVLFSPLCLNIIFHPKKLVNYFFQHIRDEYGDDPEKFNDAIEKLVEVQSAAYKAILSPDFEGCNTLKKYYGQLHYMQSRFPFSGDDGLKVTFSWYTFLLSST